MRSLASPSTLSRSLGHIYVAFCSKEPDINGYFTNSISRFDPIDNTWSYITSIPGLLANHVLRDFEMACVGNSIYVVGGRLCRKDRAEQNGLCHTAGGIFHETEVGVLSEVLRYNIESNEWSNCAPLSLQRYNFSCTVCDNKIYVAGGQFEDGNARGTSRAEVYDPLVNTWTNLPNMRRLRYKCVGVTWRNRVYVIGGFTEGCDPNQPIANLVERCSAEVYDFERGEWDFIPQMWQLDVPPNHIVAVGDRLFSCGDCLNVCKGHLDVYDGKMNMWDIVEGPVNAIVQDSKHVQKLYATMAPIGHFLYFFTGCKVIEEGVPSNFSMVFKFNTTATDNSGWIVFDPFREDEERELCCNCCVSTRS